MPRSREDQETLADVLEDLRHLREYADMLADIIDNGERYPELNVPAIISKRMIKLVIHIHTHINNKE